MLTDIRSDDIADCRVKMHSRSLWESCDPVHVSMLSGKAGLTLTVQPGTITNFASIPVFARGLVQTAYPSQCLPALVHDSLVREFSTGMKIVTWAEAADILNALLRQMGEKGWRRHLIVAAVRVWGWIKQK